MTSNTLSFPLRWRILYLQGKDKDKGTDMTNTGTTFDTTITTADVFCASPKWSHRDRTGRFATLTHKAMLDEVYNDEAEVAHAHPTCANVVGSTVAADPTDAGWLCSGCVAVDTGLGRDWFAPAKGGEKVCHECHESLPVTKFATRTHGYLRGTREDICRACKAR